MILFFRIALVLILLILGPLAWIGHNGLTITRSIPHGTMTADGPFAVSASLPIPHYFTDVPDGNNNPQISELRLFEDGKELGPPHTPVTTIKANGHGAFSHWGHRIYFSSSDDTSPSFNGRVYRAEFRVYPTIEGGPNAIPALVAIFAAVYSACRLLILMRRSKAETLDTEYLKPRALRYGIAVSGLLLALMAWLRFNSRSAPEVRILAGQISETTRALLAPRAVFKLAGLTLVYGVSIFLIVSSLTVQQSSSGELKINFEYKIF